MRARAGLLLPLGVLALGTAVLGADAPRAPRRGRGLYFHGAGAGPVVALVGGDRAEVPASVMPCVSCHGPEGEGRPEGGVRPSDIRWATLTTPYGLVHDSGRRHPAYDRRTLARAIVDGVDPAGQPLLAAMPRYRMSSADLEDLLAFLEGLGSYRDPGVTDGALRLGTLVPSAGPDAAAVDQVSAVIAAVLEPVNARGGLLGRRIELRQIPAGGSSEELRRRLEQEDVFALVGGALPADGGRTLAALEAHEIPLVGPWTPTGAGPDRSRLVFHLWPGAREQWSALVSFAASEPRREGDEALVAHPDTSEAGELGEAVAGRCRSTGFRRVERLGFAPGHLDAAALLRGSARAVFFLGDGGDLRELLRAAAAAGAAPRVFALGASTARLALESPPQRGEVYLAFPTMPLRASSGPAQELLALVRTHGLPEAHRAAQVSAYAASQVLLEGLRRAGRRLSRERLAGALEGLYRFETGVTAPVSYGPARRVGTSGACIVKLDAAARTFVPVRDWVPAEDR